MITRREAVRRLYTTAEPLYGECEARQIAHIATAALIGTTVSTLMADPDRALTSPENPNAEHALHRIATELSAGRPLQYILGEVEFCGLCIGVREGVLIPRPETEEWVMHAVAKLPTAARVLDVGTGSGCIALAVKHLCPTTEVFAADISQEALDIARKNADTLHLDVTFRCADALHSLTEAFPERFDALLSNPPYIPQIEHRAMRRNVTEYEPQQALFVPDDDPLRFYRAIALQARNMLVAGGSLYFEIHENFGKAICDLLHEADYIDIVLHRDFLEKNRMVCCRKR